jgi:hypothetical protein
MYILQRLHLYVTDRETDEKDFILRCDKDG